MAIIDGTPTVEAKLNTTGTNGIFKVSDNGTVVFVVDDDGKVLLYDDLERLNTGLIITTGGTSPIVRFTSGGKTIDFNYAVSFGASLETAENFGVVANNGLFIKKTGTTGADDFLVCEAGGAARLSVDYDSSLGRVTLKSLGETEEEDDDLYVESDGVIRVEAKQSELVLDGDTKATLRGGANVFVQSTTGDIEVKAISGNVDLIADGGGAAAVEADKTIDFVFGNDGNQQDSLRIATKQVSTGAQKFLFKVTATGDLEFHYVDKTSPYPAAQAAALRLHNPANVTGSWDARFNIGMGDDTRGEVKIQNEPNANSNKRAAILVLHDQDNTAWYLWVGSDGALYMDSTDPQTTDTIVGKKVAQQ